MWTLGFGNQSKRKTGRWSNALSDWVHWIGFDKYVCALELMDVKVF